MSNNQMLQKSAKGLAETLNIPGTPQELIQTLKSTAFSGNRAVENISDEQLTALIIVANQYGLNPLTKELFAFPDQNKGIIPIVSVDGWSRIINNHDDMDGMECEYSDETISLDSHTQNMPAYCKCTIWRKSQGHPTVVTEYLDEVYRPPFKGRQGGDVVGPWQKHTRRMLRHKAFIQCARLAFGFSGIYDQWEGEQIAEGQDARDGAGEYQPAELAVYPAEKFDTNFPAWRDLIMSGNKTAEQVIAAVSTGYALTDEQRQRIMDAGMGDDGEIIEGELSEDAPSEPGPAPEPTPGMDDPPF